MLAETTPRRGKRRLVTVMVDTMANHSTLSGADPLFRERWQVVQDEIRRRILRGELRPGQPLKEVEVADALGVSRGPVREAIRALEVSGLVQRRPQRTSIVTPITQR